MTKGTIFVRDYAACIVDLFEELLDEHGIDIPDEDRSGDEGEARVYGETYATLEEKVTSKLECLLVERNQYSEVEINTERYSGK